MKCGYCPSFVLFIAILIYFLGPKDIELEVVKAKYTDVNSKYVKIFYSNSTDQLEAHYKDEQGVIQDISKEEHNCHPSKENGFCTIVLLHGTASSLHTWDGWVQRMINYGYRLIRVDLPAYGITGHHPSHNYSIDNDVNFVHDFISKLENVPEKFSIAGNSLGGWIAFNYVLKHQERVAKLILIDSAGFFKDKIQFIFRIAKIPYLGNILKFFTPRFVFALSIQNIYGNDSKITEELVDRYYELILREGNRDGLFSRIVGRRGFISAGDGKEIKIPVLIMWGETDEWIPVAHVSLFQKDIPHSEVKIYPGVGHCPMEEIPSETSNDAMFFLKTSS